MYSQRTPSIRVAHGTEWETVWYAGREKMQADDTTAIEYGRPSKADCAAIIHNRDERLWAMGERTNFMLRNGARWYIDVGEKLEYCGPETISAEEAEQRQIDAEVIVGDAMQRMIENPDPEDRLPIRRAALYKRTYSSGRWFDKDGSFIVYDSGPKSCGFHLNFGLPRRREVGDVGLSITEEDLGLYGVHLATSAPLLGSGLVDPFEGRFLLHQRLPFIKADFSSNTTSARPVVNTRNEPHSAGSRVHCITLDPCMSPWSGMMQRGTTELVLLMSALHQPGWAPEGLQASELGTSLSGIAHRVGTDLTFKKQFTLDGTKKLTALDAQEMLHEAARKMSEEVELPPGSPWVLDEWERAISDLRKNPMLLADRHDWPMKLKMFLRGIDCLDKSSLQEIRNYPWKSQEAEIKDTEFTRIGPGTISERLRRRTWAKWMPKTEANRTMQERCDPPKTTRAVVRGGYIDLYGAPPGHETISGADWNYLGNDDNATLLGDVFATDLRVLFDTSPPRNYMDFYGAEDWSD